MNETLNEAIELLGRLRFETGGLLLARVIDLEQELEAERQRRIDELRETEMTEMLCAGGTFHDR